MDFNFSDEQTQLADAIRKWVQRAYTFERRKSIEKSGGFDRASWSEIAELGLCGLYIPEEDGGLGMGPVEGMVVMEEMGRGMVLEPLSQSFISGALLATYANAATKQQWLPAISGGEALVALAYQERAARHRLDICSTSVSREADSFKITGSKNFVPAGDMADAFIVSAQMDAKLALFLVNKDASGVSTKGYSTQDGSRAADVSFKDAKCELITADGLAALENAVDIGIAATCAQAVGAMDMCLSITAEYLNLRKQFGVPISSFQALRHRMADMKMQLELARSMSYYASLKLNAEPGERRAALSRAKYQLGVSMRFVGQQAIQLHGGIGVTDEHIISHYFRVLTQMELSWGDTLHHLGEVSERMQDTAGVF